MKVLVTGGSGFLGSHVADAFSEAGDDVLIFDRVPPITEHDHAAGDLTDLDSLVATVDGVGCICHLGGVGDVYLAQREPAQAAQANVVGSVNVVEAARRAGGIPVICASTWEVYGPPQYEPMDEKHPCAPEHPYSITKLAGERMALACAGAQVPVTALRLGTAYGTRMRANSVFSAFIGRALRREPITIQGTGEQSRQFTHARDIARAFRLAAQAKVAGEVYNIVATGSISIRQLAESICAHLPTQITYAPARLGDVPPARVSAAKAQQELGWEPTVLFEVGLEELIAFHRDANRSGGGQRPADRSPA
jgi:UDP-glucose 4-epimerase